MDSLHISSLASEILLFIFLHLNGLNLNQLVICRRVNKQFQEVIDNNQFLWRVFEWIQQDIESFRPALDIFSEKSQSSLEKVSIQGQFSKEEDLLHLMQVLGRAMETLREVELKVSKPSKIQKQVVQLLTTGSKLRALLVWDWAWQSNRGKFPLSRLLPSNCKSQKSSVGQLQLLWLDNGVKKVDSKYLNSLVSLAQGSMMGHQDCQEVISSFSETIIHLRLEVKEQSSTIKPLFCPNLKIFEGWIHNGLPSFLDAPQLKTVVIEQARKSDLELPPSVEEIWLRGRSDGLNLAEDWEPLLRLCPKLRILKLMEDFVIGFDFTRPLDVLQTRKQMAQAEKEIDGIKIVFLQKLVLPTQLIDKEELVSASKVVEEVIDVKDYPEFIEIEY